MCEASD